MRVLVTGAAGLLGREIAAAGRSAGHEVTALLRSDLDVTDRARVARRVTAERPQAVVNCAAFTDVDGAEDRPEEAWAVNAHGAEHVAEAAARGGALVVHPSTDYVFDGQAGEPYGEEARPSPLSAYGRSKLDGEQRVAAAAPRHLIVRTSCLFGPGGANFVDRVLRRAEAGGELVVVTDQVGSPTYAGHLARAILGLMRRGSGGLWHIAGGGQCSRYELAREVLRQAGLSVRLEGCQSTERGDRARRPAFSALRSLRSDAVRLPPWPEGVAAHLAERGRGR